MIRSMGVARTTLPVVYDDPVDDAADYNETDHAGCNTYSDFLGVGEVVLTVRIRDYNGFLGDARA